MMLNVMLAGVGGQGTVLLSRLIGAAALETGLRVRGTETIGMAQRGGSVVSHVRMGQEIRSPLIPRGGADLIIAFEPGEAVRVLPFLRPGGLMVVSDRIVRPVSSSLREDGYGAGPVVAFLASAVPNRIVLSGEELIRRCENTKVINVALLGAALGADVFPFGEEEVRRVLLRRLPEKFHALNLRALEIGRDMAGKGAVQ